MSRTTVTKWETGKSLPNIDTLRMISEKYEISIDELLHDEAESGFYRAGQKLSFGNMELTKKQKIIAFAAFFLVVAVIFVSVTVTNINHSPSVATENEVVNFRESIKAAPDILKKWAEDRDYEVNGGTYYSSSTWRIYSEGEKMMDNQARYQISFLTKDSTLEAEITVEGDSTDECLEKLFEDLEEVKGLLKKFSGQEVNTELISQQISDMRNEMEESLETEYHYYSDRSLFSWTVEDLENFYIGSDYHENRYRMALYINSNYYLDVINAQQ